LGKPNVASDQARLLQRGNHRLCETFGRRADVIRFRRPGCAGPDRTLTVGYEQRGFGDDVVVMLHGGRLVIPEPGAAVVAVVTVPHHSVGWQHRLRRGDHDLGFSLHHAREQNRVRVGLFDRLAQAVFGDLAVFYDLRMAGDCLDAVGLEVLCKSVLEYAAHARLAGNSYHHYFLHRPAVVLRVLPAIGQLGGGATAQRGSQRGSHERDSKLVHGDRDSCSGSASEDRTMDSAPEQIEAVPGAFYDYRRVYFTSPANTDCR